MNYLVAVDDGFFDIPGGMGRVAWDVALLMRDRGHRVAFFCTKRKPDSPPRETIEGVEIFRYQRPRLPAWHPRRDARAIEVAADAVRAALGSGPRWDVVHMHSPLTGAGVIAGLGAGPRYVYTMHSPVVLEQRINWAAAGLIGQLKLWFGLKRLNRLEERVLQPCDAIQTLSQYTKTQIGKLHGPDWLERVRVVPHWRRPELQRKHTKLQARRQLGWPLEKPLLLTVRRHGPRYGIDVAIRAVAPLLEKHDAYFYIGGDGALRPALEALSRKLGISKRVPFLGRLSDAQLALAYEAADLFVLPTRALECFGLIIQEAFAYGCPVLSSDAGAIPELMQPILPQFIVPAGDVAALQHKLAQFLDGQLLPPPPEQLVQHVNALHSREVITPQIVDLLENPRRPSSA